MANDKTAKILSAVVNAPDITPASFVVVSVDNAIVVATPLPTPQANPLRMNEVRIS